MNWPSVAIVALNWNGREHLADCLASLAAQTYGGPFQVVLADNGSTDGSVDFVRERFPSVRIVRAERNLGFAGGNNLAARQVDAEVVAFVNNDTRAEPAWLEELVAVLTQAPELAAVGGKIVNWDGSRLDFVGGGATLTGFGLQFDHGEARSPHDHERDILFACGGSMAIWRKVFLEVGGFDEDYFAFYEDVDLGWRLWLAGYRVRYAPRSVVHHRHHGTSRRIAPERLAVLYERNALFTIFKNYDDRHLQAIWPAALLLTAEKATLLIDPDRRAFVLGPSADGPGLAVAPQLVKSKDMSKVKASLRQRGFAGTAQAALRAVGRRIQPRLAGLRRSAARGIGGTSSTIGAPAIAISRLLALEEVGRRMPELQAKRSAVQAMRKRSDDDILPLFGMPLEPGFPAAGFVEYHQTLIRALGLDTLVKEAHAQSPVPHA
ncbi:MAG TPA: glycosyltransferase family 2 protein [Candidatus Eisenbacteria bacterium]|nr:glycosyltransferase family 2 protein [Candidatus Eisenbacteria bacterium]